MQTRRIAAGVIAAAVLAGSVSFAVINKGEAKTRPEKQTQQENAEYGYEYGVAQSLWFKINELWRLSLNSDLDMETVNAISALNNGFDSELLMKAVKAEGDGVVDEYIYAVLAGLDFELYLSDREAYDKARADAAYTGEVLTAAKIDEYLNRLNEETAKKQVNDALNTTPSVQAPRTEAEVTSVPEVPTAESVLPENPADAVKKETQAITNHALGIEVEQ